MIDLVVIAIIGFVFGFGVGYTIKENEMKPKKYRTWESDVEEEKP